MYKHIKQAGSEFYDFALTLSEGNHKEVFCDIETSGLDPRTDRFLLLQVMLGEEIYIFDFLNLNLEALKYIVTTLEKSGVRCVFHNAKFDMKFIYHNTGIMLSNVFDTMNCEVLINAGVGKSLYSLQELSLKYAGIELKKDVRADFLSSEIKPFTEQMLLYSAMDVKVLRAIYLSQVTLIDEAKENRVLDIEMKLLPVVAKMEYDGILLSREKWMVLVEKEELRSAELEKSLKESLVAPLIEKGKFANGLEFADLVKIPVKTKRDRTALEQITDLSMIRDWALSKFNLASSLQMRSALGLHGISVDSTNEKKLADYKNQPIVKLLLELRESNKRLSTYGTTFLDLINPVSGRIHTEFFNMGAATGRFSSNNPNMQNIPRAEGYRESFIPSPGYKFWSADYSQQEYRLAGAVSNEQRIIDAYIGGADMHTATGAIITGKEMKDVTKEERNLGKTINFAILYGSSEYGLKRNLNISIERAKEIINAFNTGYPTLHAFKTAVENMIEKTGFSVTPLGRRRYSEPMPVYMDNWTYIRHVSKIKREGFNHVIQGGGADIIKIAMINIYNKNPFGDKLRMSIQVHDELDGEVHESIAEEGLAFIREEMESAEQTFLGPIPAKVDAHLGEYWSK